MIRLQRTQGVILLDDEDAWVLDKYYLDARCKQNAAGPYWNSIAKDKRTMKARALGRVLLDCPPGAQVDHINQDGLDNRRENLRVVSVALNNTNRRSVNQFGYKGIGLPKPNRVKSPRFRARLAYQGIRYHGPYRFSPEIAALDYNRMVIAAWGREMYVNDVRCVSMEPKPTPENCLFCNAPCVCCCVCDSVLSKGMRDLFDTLARAGL